MIFGKIYFVNIWCGSNSWHRTFNFCPTIKQIRSVLAREIDLLGEEDEPISWKQEYSDKEHRRDALREILLQMNLVLSEDWKIKDGQLCQIDNNTRFEVRVAIVWENDDD